MTNSIPHSGDHAPAESVDAAKAWQMSAQAQCFATQRLNQIGEPITTADRANVQTWAEIFVSATERDGPQAMREAKARAAAAAYVRMRVREDEARLDRYDRAGRAVDHFDAGLQLYLRLLSGEPMSTDEGEPPWLYVTERDRDGTTIWAGYLCPRHGVEKRERFHVARELRGTAAEDAATFGCQFCDESEVE